MKKFFVVLFLFGMSIVGFAQSMNNSVDTLTSADSDPEQNVVVITPSFIANIQKYSGFNSFKEGFAKVKKNNQWGFINTKGEEVIPCKYNDDSVFDFSEGFARVKKENKWGFINVKDEEAILCKYDEVSDFSEGLARVKMNNKWGFINTKGEDVIPCNYDEASDFSEGLAKVMRNDNSYFIDVHGQELFSCDYYNTGLFHDGLAAIQMERKLGYINKNGKVVIPCQYDCNDCWSSDWENGKYDFSEGLAAVEKESSWGYINTQGEVVIPIKFSDAYKFNEKMAIVGTPSDTPVVYSEPTPACRNVGVIDMNEKIISPFGKYFLYNYNYMDIHQIIVSEGLIKILKEHSEEIGLVDTKGKIVVPYKYDSVENFSCGVAFVKYILSEEKGDKIKRTMYEGYVDKNGVDVLVKCRVREGVIICRDGYRRYEFR